LSVVAVIPARGGSKGVPGKNLRRIGGVPLVARAVAAARATAGIDRVLVSTDDAAIATVARAAGAEIVDRPAELAGDTASSESALLHALDQLDDQPQILVFLQATSPFIDPDELAAAVARVRAGEADVVFSAFETYAFLWRIEGGLAAGVNHDAATRPRRQDREPHFQETGAFYVMDAAGFREAGHRFFGRVAIAVTDARRALEIDDLGELELATALAPVLDAPRDAIDVDALVTDFDGVHTDDRVHLDRDGHEFVTASRSDGYGIEQLRRAGIPVLVLSKETDGVVAARARKLGIDVVQGLDEKTAALRAWIAEHGLDPQRIAYLGNDVNDLGCFAEVGWPLAVADAHPRVIAAARIVLTRQGGHGAVREAADRILLSLAEASGTGERTLASSTERERP